MTSATATTSALALVLLTAAGCAGEVSSPPVVLSDGSAARPPPVALEGVEGPSILTRMRVLRHNSVDPASPTTRCIESTDASTTAVVERVGANGASVTVLGQSGRTVYGCDASAAAAMDRSWCGHAFGRLEGGRLRDPRLSLTCRGRDDMPLGFAWIQPVAAASYLVVHLRGHTEAYPIGGRAPVRVVTDNVDQRLAGATFSVSEHARGGRRLASYRVEARVSG